MLAELVEAAKDWVVVCAGPPEAVVIVLDCEVATLGEFVMPVVEYVVVGVVSVPV